MSVFFNQPSENAVITCSAGCGESIEYGLSFRQEWLLIQDEATPELRFYCPDCKGKADIGGDPRMGQFQKACKDLIPQLEYWAGEYEAVADDFGDWMETHGVSDRCKLASLYYDIQILGGLSAALQQVAELDLENE